MPSMPSPSRGGGTSSSSSRAMNDRSARSQTRSGSGTRRCRSTCRCCGTSAWLSRGAMAGRPCIERTRRPSGRSTTGARCSRATGADSSGASRRTRRRIDDHHDCRESDVHGDRGDRGAGLAGSDLPVAHRDMGRLNQTPEGSPLPMVLEPRPGGRWYRDLAGDDGHLWGFVQSIKRPTLLEIWGPVFMSTAATSNLLYRLSETPEGTLIKFTHTLVGPFPEDHRPRLVSGWTALHARVRKDAESAQP